MKSLLRKLPGMDRFIASDLWRSYRHSVSLRTDPRKNSNFTGFMRLPAQFETLTGPVIDFLLAGDEDKTIRIFSIGCSIGAEAYTAASYLTNHRPGLRYELHGFDIDDHVIEKANSGVFDSETEVFNNKRISQDFIDSTFVIEGSAFRVKDEIKRNLTFHVADILDVSAVDTFGKADLVFAQNFLFHLEPADSVVAFDNICRLLAERSVLYVDGTDIPIRMKATSRHGLQPLDYNIEEIHNQARWARGVGWPYHYWGLEPFSESRRDWRRRYATIFLKGGA